MSRGRARRRSGSGLVRLRPEDVQFARDHAAAALAYYAGGGLALARSWALRMVLTGGIAVLGLLVWDWSPLTVLLYLYGDISITLLADAVRYPWARAWLAASHQRDADAQRVGMVVAALDDGSGKVVAMGRGPVRIGLHLLIGWISSVLLSPILVAAAVERTGADLVQAVADPRFWWLLAANAVLTVGGAILAAIHARQAPPGERLIWVQSGSVGVLWLGVMVLTWLPVVYGMPGLLWLFVVLHGTRTLFGLYAAWALPRSVRAIARRHAAGDWSLPPGPRPG